MTQLRKKPGVIDLAVRYRLSISWSGFIICLAFMWYLLGAR